MVNGLEQEFTKKQMEELGKSLADVLRVESQLPGIMRLMIEHQQKNPGTCIAESVLFAHKEQNRLREEAYAKLTKCKESV